MRVLNYFIKESKRESEFNGSNLDPILEALIKNTDIDRKKALSIPIVSSSVGLICDTFAMIPFKLYKQEKNAKGKRTTKEVEDTRVDIINYETQDTLDGFQFKKAMVEDYLLGKGGYAYIKKNHNEITGLYYTEEKNIAINKNFDPIFKNYNINVNGQSYYPHNFLKLLRNTKDGASGIGVTKEIEQALKTAFQRIVYEYNLTMTGGSRKGFIKSLKHLDEKAIKSLKDSWEKYYSGNANTVILNDGMEFQEASNNSKENELNEKNKTFISEIRDIFHIYSNYDDFIKFCIMPIATAFATALNRDCLLDKEKKEYYFAPDLTELLKGAMIERYKAYEIAIKNGFKTRNEIRYMEDDDAIDGLDTINLGLGDVLLNVETGEIYVPNTNKTVKMGEEGIKTDADENDKLPPNNSDDSNQDISNTEGGEEDEHRG